MDQTQIAVKLSRIRLSAVEREALTLLARGLTQKQIAYRLQRRHHTVTNALRRARCKLAARSSDAAVARALFLGLL